MGEFLFIDMEYTFDFRTKVDTINCVYEIKNIINGKVYIGSTFCLKKRITSHYNLLIRNKHHSIKLQRSWNKHGEENFRFLILEENINSKDILKREQFYIDEQSSMLCYNILSTAGTSLGNKWSLKAKEKYSELKKSLKLGQGVIQYDLNGTKISEYHSILEASQSIRVKNSGNIGECCRRKKRSIGGYVWEFSDKSLQSKYGFHDFNVANENLRCPHCLTDDTCRAGFIKWNGKSKQVHRCKKCGRRFNETTNKLTSWNRNIDIYKKIFYLRKVENQSSYKISKKIGMAIGSVDRILRKYKEEDFR